MPTPGTVTLQSIMTLAQQEADMVNSTFVSQAEWTSYISNSYKELYDLLVGAYGNDYYVATPSSFVTDGTSRLFSLPTDFYKLLGVDLQIGSGQNSFVTLKPFNFSERNKYTAPNFQSYRGYSNLKYKVMGSQIMFNMIPQGGQTIQLWYVPEPTGLANLTDTLDGISGWDEYIVVDAAAKALAKEESDVSVLMARKTALTQRILSMAENRDAGEPATVSDSSGNGQFGAYGADDFGVI